MEASDKTQGIVITVSASQAASALSQARWKKATKAERKRIGEAMAAGRKKRISAEKRSELASKAAQSISPKAARERAKKAWETKRKKKTSAS